MINTCTVTGIGYRSNKICNTKTKWAVRGKRHCIRTEDCNCQRGCKRKKNKWAQNYAHRVWNNYLWKGPG